MQLIVHIGASKTGTSSLQEWLHSSRRHLLDNGFHYLRSVGLRNHTEFPRLCCSRLHPQDPYFRSRGLATMEAARKHTRSRVQHLKNEVRNLPDGTHTVLASSEVFYFRLNQPQEILNFRDLAGTLCDQVRVVVYVREQAKMIESLYTTHLLLTTSSQSLRSFTDRISAPDNKFLDFGYRLGMWADAFGLESMDVSIFDRQKLVKGNVVDDFRARHLAGGDSKYPPTNVRINRSVNCSGQKILRLLNRQLAEGRLIRGRPSDGRKIKRFVARFFVGKGQSLSPDQKKSIRLRFEASNQRLREVFFPKQKVVFDTADQIR